MTSIVWPVLAGLAGPLAAVLVSWVVVSRTHRRDPGAVHGVMLTAFVVKMVFFAVYAVAMVKVLGLDVSAFGLSFAAFFIALYAVEAALFARLFRQVPGSKGPGLQGAR